MIHNFQQFQRKLKIILLPAPLSVMWHAWTIWFLRGNFLLKLSKDGTIEKDHHKIGFRIIWRKPDQMMLQFHHSWKTFQKSFASMIIDLMIQVSYKTFGSPLPPPPPSFSYYLFFQLFVRWRLSYLKLPGISILFVKFFWLWNTFWFFTSLVIGLSFFIFLNAVFQNDLAIYLFL